MQHFLGLLWGIVKMWIIYFLPTGAGAGGPLQNKHLRHSSGCQQQGGGVQGAPWKGEKAPDRENFFFMIVTKVIVMGDKLTLYSEEEKHSATFSRQPSLLSTC